MRNALTYVTRRCPRNCDYCAIRDSIGLGPELTPKKWIDAFKVLKRMKVNFNLILGNEAWLLGWDIPFIFERNEVPYAIYTTAPRYLFERYRHAFIIDGAIDNFSCGIDYPYSAENLPAEDSVRKSREAWRAFKWVKEKRPDIDTQGTVTIHKKNYKYLPQLIRDLSRIRVFSGVNFIHWNKDHKYDFFPRKSQIRDLCFIPSDYDDLRRVLNETLAIKNSRLQNPEMLREPIYKLVEMGWHCAGDPYGGPTIDADGSLRVCGYRKGTHTSQFTIFDLPKKEKQWQEAVYADAMECPGCMWSYPWMYRYWKMRNEDLGSKVFIKHAGEHIETKNWSKRKNE